VIRLRNRGVVLIIAIGTFGLLPTTARATDEIQVYNAEIAEIGQWTFQQHLNYIPEGRTQPDFPGGLVPNHSLNGTPEWARGMTDWWELGFYTPFAVDNRGNFLSDGFKIRTLFVVPDAAKRDFFYGINFEFSYTTPEFSLSRWALEVRPIIGWRNAQWELIFNPIVDATFGSHGEADFAPAVRLARKLDKDVFVGLEYYGDLGPLGNFLPLRDQQHTLFAVTDFKVGEFDVDFGIGYGLTAGSDRMAVKGILGYAFPVPGKNGDAGNDTPRAPSSPRNLTHNLSGSIFPADLPTLR
jgi:hypothetical protein